ncbi:MAG: cytochrome-c oxidase, cbb3-type subunit III, partial [Halocynthiibacter sp.]
MAGKAEKPKKPEVETTGHVWDGIEELNNPLPRWWLWTFYLTIIWAIGYTVLYPAWPLINGATPGLLGYSTRGEVAADIQRFDDANAPLEARLVATELGDISKNEELGRFAAAAGASIFANTCSACHGAGAAGSAGYPNLLDDDWLWGGTMQDIYTTVSSGIRNSEDPDARYSEMPAFGEFLEKAEIKQVVNYVLTISGQGDLADATLASWGAAVFTDNCSACHGATGTGDRFLGAPNLTDAIWLYGGDAKTLTDTVNNARFGVMPNWNTRLSESDIRAVTAYVHQLGG